jgi:hypothetical protein
MRLQPVRGTAYLQSRHTNTLYSGRYSTNPWRKRILSPSGFEFLRHARHVRQLLEPLAVRTRASERVGFQLSCIGSCQDGQRRGGDSLGAVIGQNGAQPRNPLAIVVSIYSEVTANSGTSVGVQSSQTSSASTGSSLCRMTKAYSTIRSNDKFRKTSTTLCCTT